MLEIERKEIQAPPLSEQQSVFKDPYMLIFTGLCGDIVTFANANTVIEHKGS